MQICSGIEIEIDMGDLKNFVMMMLYKQVNN